MVSRKSESHMWIYLIIFGEILLRLVIINRKTGEARSPCAAESVQLQSGS